MLRRLFVLTAIVIICYEVIILLENKQEKNDKIKELIQVEKVKDRIVEETTFKVDFYHN